MNELSLTDLESALTARGLSAQAAGAFLSAVVDALHREQDVVIAGLGSFYFFRRPHQAPSLHFRPHVTLVRALAAA